MRGVIYTGPDIDDIGAFQALPPELRALLEEMNGYIVFGGGFHLRGACVTPAWHSIGSVMNGEFALSRYFRDVLPTDIPFAQDYLGDQFFLRNSVVHHLMAETGEVQSLDVGLGQFLSNVESDPVEFLLLQSLMSFYQEGGSLEPGQSLSAYPPFCFEQSSEGRVSLRAIDTLQLLMGHARLAQAIADLPPGQPVDLRQLLAE